MEKWFKIGAVVLLLALYSATGYVILHFVIKFW